MALDRSVCKFRASAVPYVPYHARDFGVTSVCDDLSKQAAKQGRQEQGQETTSVHLLHDLRVLQLAREVPAGHRERQ